MKRVSTKDMPREEWLKLRRHTLGGSDAAAIVGLSKYSSPFSVWGDKTGRLPDKPDTEAMREGRDLEQYVADRWMEATGKKCRRLQAMLYNDKYPHSHADIDRAVIGEKAGLECKTTSTLDVKQFKGVEFPEKYYAQCVHYLAITGWDRWYLAVLVYGRGFYTYVMERDQAEIDALMAAENDFWESVSNDTPPIADGSQATTDALNAIYDGTDPRCVELFGRDKMLRDLQSLQSYKSEIDTQIKTIENQLKADMQENTDARCGDWKITWRPQTRKTFDAKALQRAYPDIDLTPFYKLSTARPFKVAENKEEK